MAVLLEDGAQGKGEAQLNRGKAIPASDGVDGLAEASVLNHAFIEEEKLVPRGYQVGHSNTYQAYLLPTLLQGHVP